MYITIKCSDRLRPWNVTLHIIFYFIICCLICFMVFIILIPIDKIVIPINKIVISFYLVGIFKYINLNK